MFLFTFCPVTFRAILYFSTLEGPFFGLSFCSTIFKVTGLARICKWLDLSWEPKLFIVNICLCSLFAILFKILRLPPRIFTGNTFCHIFDFILACLFSFFDHNLINTDKVQNFVIFAYGWRLIWCETYLPIY